MTTALSKETWQLLQLQAPDLARAIESRLNANLHHILGTIRTDGTPRLSGTEVEITPTQLRIGMMPGSLKLRDAERDPRFELHTAPLDPKLVDGDAKLRGRLRHDGDVPDQPGAAFVLDIEHASLVRVDQDALELTIWNQTDGLRTIRRS